MLLNYMEFVKLTVSLTLTTQKHCENFMKFFQLQKKIPVTTEKSELGKKHKINVLVIIEISLISETIFESTPCDRNLKILYLAHDRFLKPYLLRWKSLL